jgi:hypothetical protein
LATEQRTLIALERRRLVRWAQPPEVLGGVPVTQAGWIITDEGRAAIGLLPMKPPALGDRCVPSFEPTVATLETFAEELQSEIEWIAELHRHDKTGQAWTDQRMLGWLRRLALQLAKDTKEVALALNFGFGEKEGKSCE